MTQADDRQPNLPAGHGHSRPGHPGPAGVMPPELAAILADIAPGGTFGHREHIHLAFVTVQRYGPDRAADMVAGWIRHIAAYERAPQKFNATMTRAWTRLVAHHAAATAPGTTFADFAERNAGLLDKRLLARHYSARVLASPAARTCWVPPDLAPFPW